jgi:hypothetical protein
LYFSGHLASSSASALPYPFCCFQYVRSELRRWCHTNAAGQKPIVPPACCSRQHTSTSSPATRNVGSKPPIASSAALRTDMLHPGTCSASVSLTSTWIGPPGALATHSATAPSPGGGMLGPPIATYDESRNAAAM